MPLTGENRLLVSLGLRRMRTEPNPGLRALFEIAGVSHREAEAYHLGFTIGPRINAGGRIAHALDGVRLFTTRNADAIRSLAQRLDRLNSERQQLTQTMLAEADQQLKDVSSDLLFVHADGWSEGVVGLVAGKISDRYYRPALAASVSGTTVKGSARSIPGFDITAAIERAAHILMRYGGHAQAAGFTLHRDNLEEFKSILLQSATEALTDELRERLLKVDAQISLADVTSDLVTQLARLEPFGMANPKPVFQLSGLRLTDCRTIGRDRDHLKCRVSDGTHELELLGFGKGDLFQDVSACDSIDVVGSLAENTWQGRTALQLHIKDIRNAQAS
ncbi:MAG: Single-stranded-DNA-specific exonuclease RecJ [candidate division WS6 bacterium OLB20]|uniref:Single-stranded-DNA-specific exonuclease RecJ n=1 Tax=candidate division WS6 bacterium OLB20 TaxID=1617426 RepID=A0A136LWG7_9BACT|nr:MAG: Single-stranded-DNA-specific exonuclease RecJ [candidate division WS6 bacterium OLB20]